MTEAPKFEFPEIRLLNRVRRSYSGHSLRAGLATAAAEAEAQLHDVMRQTRHKSVEVARRYMRSSDLWRNNVTEKVMRRT
jgi:hypothetical protein